jgi:hypothetical protein
VMGHSLRPSHQRQTLLTALVDEVAGPIRACADVLVTAISPLFDHLIGPEQERLSLAQGCVRAPGPTQSRAVVRFW